LKFYISSHSYFSVLIHPLPFNLKFSGIKWREKRRVCSISVFFAKFPY
jgi:hypothetical protein